VNDLNLMILAGGISSRMKNSVRARSDLDPGIQNDARSKSKGMLTVGNELRHFLDYLLYNARQVGYRDILIIVSERDSSVREYYGKNDRANEFHGLNISYAIQRIPEGRDKPLGTADAVVQGLNARPDWKGKKFTVCNCDNLYSRNALETLLQARHQSAMIDYDRDALGFEASRVLQFSVIQKDKAGFLTAIIEKPSMEEIEKARGERGRIGVSMNIFRLQYDAILPFVEAVPLHPMRNEKELPVAVSMMAHDHPGSVYAYPLAEHVPDLSTIDDVGRVKEYLATEFKSLKW
jgi:NDP-sugar pyrophosphorylase family protein